jgi:hypothetical protein
MLKISFIFISLAAVLIIVLPNFADELPTINIFPTKQETNKATDSKKNTKTQNQKSTVPLAIINPAPPPPLQENRENESHQYGKEQKSSWWNFSLTDALLAIFTFALVIVGLFQFHILRGTLRATKVAADAAKESADLQKITMLNTQRAFIFLQGFQTINNIDSNTGAIQYFILEPKFVNYGKTPGLNINAARFYEFYDIKVPIDKIVIINSLPKETEKTQASLGPGEPFSTNSITITMQDAIEIFSKNKRCFVKIALEYNDWFSNTPLRHTNYFSEIEVFIDPGYALDNPNVSIFRFNVFYRYNDAD